MGNHTLINGTYSFNADDNQNDGVDNLFAHEYGHDVEYNMQNGLLLGVGESANGLNVLKSLKGFDNYWASPIFASSNRRHTVTGSDEANIITGGTNDDRIFLSKGGDKLYGLGGIDTLNGSKLNGPSGIIVDLRDEQSINTGDEISGFENVVGTSKNDLLLGNDQDNRLKGGDGKDFLYGFDGDDTLIDKQGNGDMLAGLNGHNDVAEIGDAELTGTFQSPALLALIGIPAGGFLQFTRSDGGVVNVHESTETITTDGESRKWYEWYGDAVQLPDPSPVEGLNAVTVDNTIYSVPNETTSLTDVFLQNGNQELQSVDFDGGADQLVQTQQMTVTTASWQDTYAVNRVARSSAGGDDLQAKQVSIDPDILPASQVFDKAGSILEGSSEGETLRGLAGWDVIDAKGGNDLVRGGNGRDVISGGAGADELHGDFGWNTYTDERDGADDLIAIKSDHFLVNWWYGTDSNSPNGEKADIIEGLDANDQIKILGVTTDQLSFGDASAHGVQGIGIFADGILEAVYTGGDMNSDQLSSITTGDASELVMNNQLWSYNFGNEIPPFV